MNIRLANFNDINQILEIVEDARLLIHSFNFKQWTKESNYPNYDTFLNDINNGNLYVLEDEKTIVSFIAVIYGSDPNYQEIDGNWLTNNNTYLTIHRLAVRKEYYGKKLAQQMFEFAFSYAKIHNISSIKIDTHPQNLPMNNLIKKLGFSYCGLINILDDKIDPKRNAYEKVI